MTKLRTIAIAAAIAAAMAASQARATEGTDGAASQGSGDGAWNTQYGLIFSVPNLLQNNSRAVLSDFNGGVGLQYTLAPQTALRMVVDLSRASNAEIEFETTNLASPGAAAVKSVDYPNDFTSRYDVALGAQYMMRLSPSALSPYLGLGGGLGYSQEALKYTDDVNSQTTVFKRDDMSRTFSLEALGTLGVEWRVHQSVALFAEYGLGLSLMSYTSEKQEQSTTVKSTGVLQSGTKSEGSGTKFFNFDTGLGQAGQIGLAAFF